VTTPVPPDFYRAFEDRHRGTRALIKSRLSAYLPFVAPLAAQHPDLAVLDLGCGRGEWLELLLNNHIEAHGVDLDDGMLAACRERHLSVANADAITHLQAQPDQSLLAVTGFHIAEHLPFSQLQTLFAQAHRALLPGGLLILETPNPENLVVGTASFYLDPTHQRPLPWPLMQFMAEHQGFGPVKLMRLQQDPSLHDGTTQPGLYDVLGGASPDYAIVAQKTSPATQSAPLAQAFSVNYGLPLDTLANRYDQHLQATIQTATHTAQVALRTATQALSLAQHNAARSEELAATLTSVYASRSWRITRPLRWLTRLLTRNN